MKDTASSIVERQLQSEINSILMGIQDYRKARIKYTTTKGLDSTQLAPENRLLKAAIGPTVSEFQRILRVPLKNKPSSTGKATVRSLTTPARLAEVLQEVDVFELAFLTVRHLLQICHSAPLTPVCVQLGVTIEKHIGLVRFQKDHPGLFRIMNKRLQASTPSHKERALTFTKNKVGVAPLNWKDTYRFHIGRFLIEACARKTKLWAIHQGRDGIKRTLLVVKTTFLEEQLAECNAKFELLRPRLQPMVSPPKPWTAIDSGGYLSGDQNPHLQMPLIKTRKPYILKWYKQQDLSRTFRVVNSIQEEPWRINKRVLHVMEECQKTGMGKLPVPKQEMVLPPKIWSSDEELSRLKAERPERFLEWKKERALGFETWFRDKSKRTAIKEKLRIAADLVDEEAFYFIWVLDYRGRIYPVQAHVNPQADDAGKALIEFAKGKPLGEAGAYWLAVAGAGYFGEDKITFDERVQWIKEHQEAILDSAENPLDGGRFWTKADKPFLFLSFCFEWAGYVREGVSFVSHFPVQMDGACSGLQHFSGLLRDEVGGKAVALAPGKRPSDVYRDVAVVVNRMLDDLIKQGGEDADYAALWKYNTVDRSVTKRNVMTYAYSATLRGFADQNVAFIRKKQAKDSTYFEGADVFKAAMFLAKVNHKAISQVLVKAVEAMEYLQALARAASVNGVSLQWKTPFGFPVWQEYLKTKTIRISTLWGGVQLREPEASKEPKEKLSIRSSLREDLPEADASGAANGIAPNFIHSHDAAHLMMTVEKCNESETDFSLSLIHDSFGCHACDIPELNKLLRDAFVELYSENLIEKFAKEVIDKLPSEAIETLPPIPAQGDLDLDGVRRSAYFFS